MSAAEWILSGLAVVLALWIAWLLMALDRTATALAMCRSDADHWHDIVKAYEGTLDDDEAGQ